MCDWWKGNCGLEEVLWRFHEECPEPNPEDVERWRRLHPEHGDEIAAFAADSVQETGPCADDGVAPMGLEHEAGIAHRAATLTRRLIEQDRHKASSGAPSEGDEGPDEPRG